MPRMEFEAVLVAIGAAESEHSLDPAVRVRTRRELPATGGTAVGR